MTTRTRLLSDDDYQQFVGELPPEEALLDNETQNNAARAIDRLHDKYEALVTFVMRNPRVFAEFHELCNDVEEASATVKAAMRDVEPSGPFKYRNVQRKATPMSVFYDPTKLPPEILRRPGIVVRIDGKTLDKLGVGELASYAPVLRDARVEEPGTPGIVIPLKAPDIKVTKALLDGRD